MELRLPPYAELDGQPSRPSEPQREFHRLARTHTYTYMMGGMGSGKSWAGAVHMIRAILSNRALAQERGYLCDEIAYIAAAPTYQLVRAGPWASLLRILRDIERINGFSLLASRPKKSQPPEIRLVTGDVIEFVSIDSGRYAGRTAAGWWYDECDHVMSADAVGGFNLLDDRLRDSRVDHLFGVCTSTPPRTVVGVAHMFVERASAGDHNYAMVTSHTDQNPYHEGTDYVARRSATMSARERRIMLWGEVLQPTGTVYAAEFDQRRSIDYRWRWRGAKKSRQAGRQIFLAIDWPSSGHALLVEYDPAVETLWEEAEGAGPGAKRAQLAMRGRTPYVVFDELATDNQTPEHFCAAIVARCEEWGIARDQVAAVYCDTMPRHARQTAYRDEFWRGRVVHRPVRGARRDKECGIDTVRYMLEDGDGRRRLKFAARLLSPESDRGIIRCMQSYQEIQATRDGIVVRTGRWDNASPWGHGPDALRYLLWIRESHRRFFDGGRVAA